MAKINFKTQRTSLQDLENASAKPPKRRFFRTLGCTSHEKLEWEYGSIPGTRSNMKWAAEKVIRKTRSAFRRSRQAICSKNFEAPVLTKRTLQKRGHMQRDAHERIGTWLGDVQGSRYRPYKTSSEVVSVTESSSHTEEPQRRSRAATKQNLIARVKVSRGRSPNIVHVKFAKCRQSIIRRVASRYIKAQHDKIALLARISYGNIMWQPGNNDVHSISTHITEAETEIDQLERPTVKILHAALEMPFSYHLDKQARVAQLYKHVACTIAVQGCLEYLQHNNVDAVIVSGPEIANMRFRCVAYALRQYILSGGVVVLRATGDDPDVEKLLREVFALRWRLEGHHSRSTREPEPPDSNQDSESIVRWRSDNAMGLDRNLSQCMSMTTSGDCTFDYNPWYTPTACADDEHDAEDSVELRNANLPVLWNVAAPTVLVNVPSHQSLYRSEPLNSGVKVDPATMLTLVAIARFRQRGWICFIGCDTETELEADVVGKLVGVFNAERERLSDAGIRKDYSGFIRQWREQEAAREDVFSALENAEGRGDEDLTVSIGT